MYEAVHPGPHGDSTVARHAATAARCGFEGVVVRARPGDDPGDLAAVREATDVDVVDGVEVVADDPGSARGHVGNLRPDHTLLLVRGGDAAMNRFAVESPRVDVLTGATRNASAVNHVLARAAAANDVAVEFDFGPVLRESGEPRVRALRGLRKVRELVDDAGAPVVVSAGPSSHLQQRAPRELLAVGECIGLDAERVSAGLERWGEIAAQNRHRQSDSFVAPGVEVDRGDEA